MTIPSTSAAPVWLHVGTLLDGTNPTPRRNAHIVYTAREIIFVGSDNATPPRELLRNGQTAPDASLPDATILPGLIEAHAHLFLEGGELNLDARSASLKQSPDALLAAAKLRLPKLVRLGITAVRDAGDKDGVGLAISKLYKAGQVSDLSQSGSQTRSTMPYLDSPGAAIHHRGRYGGFMADAIEHHASLRAVVESRIAAGADRIKLIPTGIISFKKGAVTTEPQMTTAEVAEIAAAAKSSGRQTFAHASGDVGIDRAIDGGVDSIEHGFFLRDDQLAKMRDKQIAWVPTFAPVQAQLDHAGLMGWDDGVVVNLRRILDQHAAMLTRAHDMGVLIIAGSDAGSFGVAHGIGLLHEMELMERAGLPPLAVINAATGASSVRLDYKEKLGRIAPGFLPRFIVAHHSPLATVRNLRRARDLVFDGDVFSTDETTDCSGL